MDKSNYKILIVDDEPEYRKALSIILEDIGYTAVMCSNGLEAMEYLSKSRADLVITDLKMPVMSGIDLIKKIREQGIDTEILVITAYGSIESAVDAIKLGAFDYFVKSGSPEELIVKVDRIAELSRFKNKAYISAKRPSGGDVFLESENRDFQNIIDMCDRIADTDINILILGESGVGKEVIANYIHRMSGRAGEPFVPINCQVFPEGVMESELFGHEKGAFTGALETRIGKFEEANHGTLFLDEEYRAYRKQQENISRYKIYLRDQQKSGKRNRKWHVQRGPLLQDKRTDFYYSLSQREERRPACAYRLFRKKNRKRSEEKTRNHRGESHRAAACL